MHSLKISTLFLSTLTAILLSPNSVFSQDEAAPATTDDKEAFDPAKANLANTQRMLIPNPFDKFLGLEIALSDIEIDWAEIYNEKAVSMDPNAFLSNSSMALAVGVRVTDGMLAIKAQNVEALNESAAEIEQLARRLGVTEGELSRAKAIQSLGNKGDWLAVFSELARLQMDVLRALHTDGREDIKPLVIAGGWMQAANYVTYVVNKNYSEETSNILREPVIIEELQKEMSLLSAPVQAEPKVAKIIETLPKFYDLVNIPKDGSVSQKDVEFIQETTNEIVLSISQG